MNEEYEYGPWIDHDGKGYPYLVVNSALEAGWHGVILVLDPPGRTQTPQEQLDGYLAFDHPGWWWRKKYILFGPLVASDKAYARILQYRFFRPKPKGEEKSEQVELLRAIAKGDKEPAYEPQELDA